MKKAVFLLLIILCVFSQLLTASADSEKAASILADMTLEQKITQMIFPAFRTWGPKDNSINTIELNDKLHEILGTYSFGGVTLYGANIVNAEQTIRLINDIQKTSLDGGAPAKLLITIDQEGGYVTRLKTGTQMPGNMALGATGDPENARKAARVIGKELAAQGINVDFAPVVDVNNNPSNPVIGIRSFSDDPDVIASYAIPYIEGLHESGIISCLKHFPGHGDTSTDSHTGLPLINKTLDELKETELVPYQTVLPYTDMVMTAHIQFPQIETQTWTSINEGEEIYLPATLSKKILTDLLRKDLGYQGIIAADAMEMDAIINYFGPLDAARLAVNAGIDILLVPIDLKNDEKIQEMRDYIAGVAALVESGEIEISRIDDAVTRILTLKDKYGLLDTTQPEGDDTGIADAVKIVGSRENHEIEWDIAKAAVTILKNEDDLLPLAGNENTAIFVPGESQINSIAYAVNRLKAEGLLPEEAEPQVLNMYAMTVEEMFKAIAQSKVVIAVTALYSEAELDPESETGIESAIVDLVLEKTHAHDGRFVLISAHLPYDSARYPQADAVLTCYSVRGMTVLPGDNEIYTTQYGPNLPAAVYTVFGGNAPAGKLPVNIPEIGEDHLYAETNAYERGFGLTYPVPEPEELSAEELFQAGQDAYNAKNYAQALEYYQTAAALGHAHAVNNLGLLYTYGYGVEQSWEKALDYYQQAAEMGYAKALLNLGKIYENGYGTEKSIEKALDYFQQAEELGEIEAYNEFAWLYFIGNGVDKSYEKAVEYWQLGVENGNSAAQGHLGIAYRNGLGVEQSDEKALEFFLAAAENNDWNSLNALGEMYRDGQGVEQDIEKALSYFQQAAELNHPVAMNNIGIMYRDGMGVEQDTEKAAEYFKKAAELGNIAAAENLEELDEDAHTLIYFSNAEISGDFSPKEWWSNGSMENMIRDITNDYATVSTDRNGALVINQTVCESIESEINEDGTKTFTIRIKDGLLFNNGESISIKDFVWSNAVHDYEYIVGGQEYNDGTAESITGLRIPDEHTIQVTISADYIPYYYDMLFASFIPLSMKYWLGEDVDIRDDGEGVYFTGLDEKAFEHLNSMRFHAGEDRVTAGPYNLVAFDPENQRATLTINKYYDGNFEGQKPSIKKIIINGDTSLSTSEAMKTGDINFLEKISADNGFKKILNEVNDEKVRETLGYGFNYVLFDYSGYSEILFQSDFGPTRFPAVRQAIALLLDRETYKNSKIGDWGKIINGPYGTAMWMAQEAEEWLDENLNHYAYDPEKAVELLVKDGWIYDENGDDYTEGIRYRKVTEEEAGSFEHIRKLSDGTLLMGLEIDWAYPGNSADDTITDLLVKGEQTAAAGMKLNIHDMTFSELLNYYYRDASKGEQYGIPTYDMFSMSFSFAPQFGMTNQFSEDSVYNFTRLYDEELNQLSIDMTSGVESGDDEAFLEKWKAFMLRWNELLPELPLFSGTHMTIFPDWLEGYEENAYWDFDKAILYASIRE